MKLRKEFKEAVQKKIPPGKMNRAVQSKDARIIYSVIIDSYQTTKGTFIIYVIPDFWNNYPPLPLYIGIVSLEKL